MEKLIINYPYVIASILFVIGTFTVLTRSNLFKKLIGINIMESAIFLLFIASGNVRDGTVPIVHEIQPDSPYVNPLPSALMLTGIVVSVSVTAFALALIVRLYQSYGSVESQRIVELRNVVSKK
ncbi:MAG: cation:proton antiporter subunit C, partial [Firmicutes bacterium]|nr:cation:proton antiporter subunit C [Bacillota bacterium]